MRFGKRRQGAESAQPLGSAEPAVEGDAVELPPVEPAAPIYEPSVPSPAERSAGAHDPIGFPAGEQPVTVAEAASRPGAGAPVAALGDSGEAFASGHAPAPAPSWQEPVKALADERPELVVAAAFAGGIVAAMILRRLGN